MKEKLKEECSKSLLKTRELIEALQDYRNEQWVLDYCDKLNQLSIIY